MCFEVTQQRWEGGVTARPSENFNVVVIHRLFKLKYSDGITDMKKQMVSGRTEDLSIVFRNQYKPTETKKKTIWTHGLCLLTS
jgi:hypothetical protein